MRKGRSNEVLLPTPAENRILGRENSWCLPEKRSRIARIFTDLPTQKGALPPYVRLAQFAKTQTQHAAASRFLVLRSAGLRAGAKVALREQPGLCWARADGAERGRLPYPRLDGSRQGIGPERQRHRTPVERVPPPPGDPARRPGQLSEYRLPAAPLDLRHGGRDRKSTRLNSSHSQISYAVF